MCKVAFHVTLIKQIIQISRKLSWTQPSSKGYLDAAAFRKELDLGRSILQEGKSTNSESGPDRSHGTLPIGVGFIAWILDKSDGKSAELLSIALEARVAAVWFAFGNDIGKWVRFVRTSDERRSQPLKTKVFILVNSLDEARRAVYEWDADVLVAQGNLRPFAV